MRPRRPSGTDKLTDIIDKLGKKYGRYALVVGVAKRTHDLKERIDSAVEPSDGGLINRAINEMGRGTVRLRGEESEEESG